jgi:hypothetical protein
VFIIINIADYFVMYINVCVIMYKLLLLILNMLNFYNLFKGFSFYVFIIINIADYFVMYINVLCHSCVSYFCLV